MISIIVQQVMFNVNYFTIMTNGLQRQVVFILHQTAYNISV